MKKFVYILIMGTFLIGSAIQAGAELNTQGISVLSGEEVLRALKEAYGKKWELQGLLRQQNITLKNATASNKVQAQTSFDTLKEKSKANQNLILSLEKRLSALHMTNQMYTTKRESQLQASNVSKVQAINNDAKSENSALVSVLTTTLKDTEEKLMPSSSVRIGAVSAPNTDQAGNQASVEETLNAFKENYYKVLRLRKIIDEQNKIIRSSTALVGHKEKAQAQVNKILKPFNDAKAQLTALNRQLRSLNQGDKIAQIKTDIRNKLGLTSTLSLKTEEQLAVAPTIETSSQPGVVVAGPEASIAKREGLLSRAERRALRKNAKKAEKVNDEDAALMSVRDLYGNSEDF